MKVIKNTLYVTLDGAYVSKDGETVLVRQDGEVKLRVPIHTLAGIVCFGRVSVSPALMGFCGEQSVAISFLSEYGKFLARVEGKVSGNVLLRRTQYRWADRDDMRVGISRACVLGKIANCRSVLSRAARGEPGVLIDAGGKLRSVMSELEGMGTVDGIRNLEAQASRVYFGVFDELITSQKKAFFFRQRSRRPPLDNVNALLSFLYVLLMHDVAAGLQAVGLDPAVGFMHTDRPGRMSLALDLMEEFRPFLADRLALTLVNRQQIKGSGFRKTDSGAVIMNDKTRKEVLVAYQTRKRDEIEHPYLKEKMAVGLLPHVQAMLLARYLRGDIDGYPPFIWK